MARCPHKGRGRCTPPLQSWLLVRLALQVGYFVGLRIRPVLRTRELVLRLALALFLTTLALEGGVVGEIARRLLCASSDLVQQTHLGVLLWCPNIPPIPGTGGGETV